MRSSSPGILFLGILAVLFGLVGAYGVKKHLETNEPEPAEAPSAEPMLTVPLAIRDLAEGRKITNGDFTTVALTESQAADMQLPVGVMTRASQIVGRTLRSPVAKGQAFLPPAFYPDGIGPDIARRLQGGQRAVTIPFDDDTIGAGLITPGAQVDVLFRTTADQEQGVPEATMALLVDVQVLAVDRETEFGATPSKEMRFSTGTVTLSVSPLQARALKVVEGRGTLSLVLRGDQPDRLADPEPVAASDVNDPTLVTVRVPTTVDDLSSLDTRGPTTLTELLGIREPEPPQKLEIYRRGQLTTVFYGEEGRTVIQDAPFGMPVAEKPSTSERRAVSQAPTASGSGGNAAAAATQAACGCGAAVTSNSVLTGKQVALHAGR